MPLFKVWHQLNYPLTRSLSMLMLRVENGTHFAVSFEQYWARGGTANNRRANLQSDLRNFNSVGATPTALCCRFASNKNQYQYRDWCCIAAFFITTKEIAQCV